jgi:hypothetical protein
MNGTLQCLINTDGVYILQADVVAWLVARAEKEKCVRKKKALRDAALEFATIKAVKT